MHVQGSLQIAAPADRQAGAQVELFDNGVSQGLTPLVGGAWEKTLSGMGEGPHAFTARIVDGSNVSEPWLIKVEYPVRDVENFDSVPDTVLYMGQSIETPTMTLTFLQGDKSVRIASYKYGHAPDLPIPGKIDGQVLHMHDGWLGGNSLAQTVSLKLKKSYSKVSFCCRHTQEPDHLVSFYKSDGSLLGSMYLPYPSEDGPESIFLASGIQEIVIKTARPDWFMLDFFKFSGE